MTLFAAALRLTGLSQQEASEFISNHSGRAVSLDTISNMSSGRSNVGDHCWAALRELYSQQVNASEEALTLIAEIQPDELDLSAYGKSDEWPSQRVFQNAMAMVALGCDTPIANE